MKRHLALIIGIASVSLAALAAQTSSALGDRTTPLRALNGAGNVGISNAVLRDQQDIRVIRVVVEPGGKRAMHAHTDVKFHMFVPITAAMVVDLDGGQTVDVPAWQPYYMKAGTQHGFHNPGSSPVEIMEVFVK
ncbi:MAG TPA: cupin domain-containing protein [Vicinamibacterales bacterium]|nr:cupin domain-containing protein [Vicinamibacterales bacterium]